MPDGTHVIILIHGIRDFALWQNEVRKALEQDFIVENTNYGRFDLIRFLIPTSYFRKKAIDSVWNQIRDIKKLHPDTTRFSYVGHSFGTYVLANIMQREFDFVAHKIVFCGSVLKYNVPFEQVSERFKPPLLNEVGARDVWPALAESVTWGYGSTGTYGFRRSRVHDRWHSGAGHGYFLNAKFCKKYWIPFFRDNLLVEGAEQPEKPARWLTLIYTVRLKYVALLFLGVLLAPNALSLMRGALSLLVSEPPVTATPQEIAPPEQPKTFGVLSSKLLFSSDRILP